MESDIPQEAIEWEFFRSSGPGGQNVNKVSTAVRLRFDLGRAPFLTPEVKARLITLAGGKMTADGVLIIEARRFRTQEANRADALDRLLKLIEKARQRPVPRRATAPSRAERERRLESKKRQGAIKRQRGSGVRDED